MSFPVQAARMRGRHAATIARDCTSRFSINRVLDVRRDNVASIRTIGKRRRATMCPGPRSTG